jgi:hypothetical protein
MYNRDYMLKQFDDSKLDEFIPKMLDSYQRNIQPIFTKRGYSAEVGLIAFMLLSILTDDDISIEKEDWE